MTDKTTIDIRALTPAELLATVVSNKQAATFLCLALMICEGQDVPRDPASLTQKSIQITERLRVCLNNEARPAPVEPAPVYDEPAPADYFRSAMNTQNGQAQAGRFDMLEM